MQITNYSENGNLESQDNSGEVWPPAPAVSKENEQSVIAIAAFQKYLLPEENIVWADLPNKDAYVKIPIRQVITSQLGFFLPALWMGSLAHALNFLIFVIAFSSVLVTLVYMASTKEAKNRFYAVTDRRVLLLMTGKKTRILEVAYAQLKKIRLKRDTESIGAVHCIPHSGKSIKFLYINQAEEVYNTTRHIWRQAER